MTDPAGLRATYERGTLEERDVGDSWLVLLQAWFAQAAADPAVLEPNAIQLATADAHAIPAVRTVLVKGIDERGIVFYTNYRSAKARDLEVNPNAAAVFGWLAHQRQVRLSGVVSKLDRDETARYFESRPRESQLGAWASPQSSVVDSRAALDALLSELELRFGDEPIPPPPHWGGYLLTPRSVEFWQGRHGRLHDRIRFRRDGSGTGTGTGESWLRERLAP